MEEQRETLERQLDTVNQSVFFLILIIFSVLLSFWSVLIQRGQLADALEGRSVEGAPGVFPIQAGASALIVGSLGFFFCLALQTFQSAAGDGDPAARKSAGMNLWASLFVLAAALIRLYNLNFTQRNQSGSEGEAVQPD